MFDFDRNGAEIAGEIFHDLTSKGKKPPVKDLLISATAIAYDLELLTCDRDFEMFKKYGLKVKILNR